MPHKAPGKSHRNGLSLVELLRMFPDDDASRTWFERARWGGEPWCPHCGSTNVQSGIKHKSMTHRCREKECAKRFSVRVGTPMHRSHLSYQTWAIAVYLLTTSLKGVSSMKLHRDLKITQKSAWYLAQRIRETWKSGSDPFSGPAEADETYVGGKRKNMSNAKRKALKGTGRGAVGKAAVAGVKDRDTNKVAARVMQETDAPALQGFVREHVEPGATPVTKKRSRPVLLDLFCCAGGAADGYRRAGFDVVGVDIRWQFSYPFEFIHADVMTLDPQWIGTFDVVHASPPCQAYSDLAARTGNGDAWPDLVGPVRELLRASGAPYIIENVEGAPLQDYIVLCGTMFPGLRVLRHRLFESNMPISPPGPCKPHPLYHTLDKRKAHYGKTDEMVDFASVNGGGNCSVVAARDAMGIDWMTKQELNEAIPPAYTDHLGRQVIAHLGLCDA